MALQDGRVCPLPTSHLHCLTSPLYPFAINRGQEPAGHGPRATAKLSPLKFWLHGSLHRRWRVLNSLLERAALLFTHVALTLPLSFTRYPVGQRASLWLQTRHKACQRPPSAREAARSTCKHSLFTSPSPHLPRHAPTPGRLRSKINYRTCFPTVPTLWASSNEMIYAHSSQLQCANLKLYMCATSRDIRVVEGADVSKQ